MSNATNSINNSSDIICLGSTHHDNNLSVNNESELVNQSDGIICLGSTHENESYSVNQSDEIITLGSTHGIASMEDEEDSADQYNLCPLQVVFSSSKDTAQEEMTQTSPTEPTRNKGRKGYQSLRANAEPSRKEALARTPPQPRTRTTALMIRAENHPDVIARRKANARRARQASKKASGPSK